MKGQVPDQSFDLTTGEGVTELEVHVQCRLGRQLRNFRVMVTDGGVILRGQTHTYYTKQLAQHAVMEVIRLPIVANEIEVI
jgi:osmotically-inducible protein OsmY